MTAKPNQIEIDRLNRRLDALNARLQWITDTEARAAWVNGYGANGELDAQRTRIIEQLEATLDELEAKGGAPAFHAK